MTRKERLTKTLRGEPVDRPPVSFYEIGGHEDINDDTDPFNIFSDPSWHPVIDLAKNHSDRLIWTDPQLEDVYCIPGDVTSSESRIENGSRYTTTTVRAGSRTLQARTRLDPDLYSVWTEEHLLKDMEDLHAYLELPEPEVDESIIAGNIIKIKEIEESIGDSGLAVIDIEDPLCHAAQSFDMADFLMLAMSETAMTERLLTHFTESIHKKIELISEALPGRLWRIVGPEYASPPYLPPELFERYVTKYDAPIVERIHRHGGFARIHSHGNLKQVLDAICATGCMALDPVEPPPQGDVELSYVREKYGEQLVLFGNLEASDLENLPTPQWADKINQAIEEGTAGSGRGFVLMPSASPYGRKLSPLARANYEKMIEIVESL